MPSKIHRFGRPLAALLAIVFACPFTSDAFALTAKEVTSKMSKQERFSYLSGLIDMNAFEVLQQGNDKAAQCIHDAYYRNIGDSGDAWVKLYNALDQFPDKQATSIIYLLAKKICGER